MLSTLDKFAVRCFLKTSCDLIKKKRRQIEPRYYDINGRSVCYKQAIIDIGLISKEQVWDYVTKLIEEECFRVSRDYDKRRDLNSEIFEFIKIINEKEVYIKLTLRGGENNKILCLSFHESTKTGECLE